MPPILCKNGEGPFNGLAKANSEKNIVVKTGSSVFLNWTFPIPPFLPGEKDFKYETLRSGGPGGQHVNKVSTAVRATHLPTGISVLASEGRSQVFNKKMAKARLINLLKAKQLLEKRKAAKKQWRNHYELERGNPVRVFRGSDFKSQFVSKSYKSQRQKAKLDLKSIVS